MSFVAYDFGGSIEVLELDELDAAVSDKPVAVVEIGADRNEQLRIAGWRVTGSWTRNGEWPEAAAVVRADEPAEGDE